MTHPTEGPLDHCMAESPATGKADPPGCKQCPWIVGDIYQRDCGYPDCSPVRPERDLNQMIVYYDHGCDVDSTITADIAREDAPVIAKALRALKADISPPPQLVPSVEPIARVINNNQPGWTNIVDTAPNVTLEVGAPLYSRESVMRLAAALAGAIHKNEPPPQEPHVMKQIEHALKDHPDKISRELADYIVGCIADYRCVKEAPPPQDAVAAMKEAGRQVYGGGWIDHGPECSDDKCCCGLESWIRRYSPLLGLDISHWPEVVTPPQGRLAELRAWLRPQEKFLRANSIDGTADLIKDTIAALERLEAPIPERLTFTLGSGQAATQTKNGAIHWLKHLFEYYNEQERDWYYNSGFSEAHGREWMRYRQEAAALAFAIQLISGEQL